jgi:S-adenosylmethionine decarboxylase proenzyme
MAHLLGKIFGVKINTVDDLNRLMDIVADDCRLNVVGKCFHQFDPYGATGVLVLSESHFSAHTYPEHKMVYIDVFCCSPTFSASYCASVIEQVFQSQSSEWQIVAR